MNALGEDDFQSHELLFEYLMPDWQCPQIVEVQDYELERKINQFNEAVERATNQQSNGFFRYIFKSFNASDSKYKVICLRLLCQFLHEIQSDFDELCDNIDDILLELLEKTLLMEVSTLKTQVLEIILSVAVAIKSSITFGDNSLIEILQNSSKFSEMAFQLKNERVVEFQQFFLEFIDDSVKLYGDYSNAAIVHQVRLLVFMAEKLKLSLTVDVITRKFPIVGTNVTIMTTLDELQMFNNFKVTAFKSKKLQRMVSHFI